MMSWKWVESEVKLDWRIRNSRSRVWVADKMSLFCRIKLKIVIRLSWKNHGVSVLSQNFDCVQAKNNTVTLQPLLLPLRPPSPLPPHTDFSDFSPDKNWREKVGRDRQPTSGQCEHCIQTPPYQCVCTGKKQNWTKCVCVGGWTFVDLNSMYVLQLGDAFCLLTVNIIFVAEHHPQDIFSWYTPGLPAVETTFARNTIFNIETEKIRC